MIPLAASEVSTGAAGVARMAAWVTFAATGLALGFGITAPVIAVSTAGGGVGVTATGVGVTATGGVVASSGVSAPRKPRLSFATASDTAMTMPRARTERR